MRRIMSKVAALATVVCLLLSLSVTAHAADVNGSVMGEPIAATVLTAEEKAEQELLAKAIVASAQYLKLSVTEMNLKAGEKCPNCDFVAPAEETKDPCEDGKHNYENGVCTECGAKDPDYKPTDPTPGNPDEGEEGDKCEHNNDPATCPDCNKDTDGENTEKPGNPDGTEQPGEGGTPGGGNTEGGDNTGTGGDSGDVSTPEGGDNAGTGGTEGEEGNTGTGNGANQPGDGDGVKDPPIDNEVKDPFANLDLAA